MCLIYNKNTTPQNGFYAYEDIRCYKVLAYDDFRKGWVSPLYNNLSIWRFELHDTKMSIIKKDDEQWLNVWAYYKKDKCWRNRTCPKTWFEYSRIDNELKSATVNPVVNLGVIEDGLHAFTYYMNGSMIEFLHKISTYDRTYGVFRGIIPKGSKYYIGDTAETVVSNKMCVVSPIDIVVEGEPIMHWKRFF